MKKICFLAAAAVLAFTGAMFAGCDTMDDGAQINPGDSTTNVTDQSPTELSASEVAYAFIEKQSELSSYCLTTTGETAASMGIITYTQDIDNVVIKHGDEYFEQSVSTSLFVNMSHQAFVKGDSVAYRNATSGDISTATKSEYKAVYGISPDDLAIGGYIFNDKTILSAELTSTNSDGTYTYTYVLDGDAAGANMKLQMKEFGSLSGYPAFSSLTLQLTISSDWTPVSISTTAEYTITKAVFGEMSCTQNLTGVYSEVNGTVTIPDTEAFNAAIGSTPSDVSGGTAETSLYMRIAEGAMALDWATGRELSLSLSLSMTAGDTDVDYAIPADLFVKYNEDAESMLDMVNFGLTVDFSDFPYTATLVTAFNADLYGVCENITEISLYYIGDGNLYVTLSGGDITYLIDYVDLTSTLGSLLADVDLTSVSDLDIESIFTVLNAIFVEDGNTLSLNDELAQSIGEGFNLELVADFSEDMLSSLGLSISATLSDIYVKINATLSDGGAIASGKISTVKSAIAATLEDDEAAAVVREGIANLNTVKAYGESYYASEVSALQSKYAALTDAQKALVINYNLLPDENGEISGVLLTAFNGFGNIDFETGVCLSIDINIGLLMNMGLDGYMYGDLYFKYNAQAIEEGDYMNAVNFRLDIDLSNYEDLLLMVQAYAADALPFDAALLSLTKASVYYVGDGCIYLELIGYDIDAETGEKVYKTIYFKSLDLADMMSDTSVEDDEIEISFAGLLSYLDGMSDPVLALKTIESMLFTETDSVNGTTISLNEDYVTILAGVYESLVEMVVESASDMGTFVTSIIETIFACDITEAYITVDNAGIFKGVSLVVGGDIASGEDVVTLFGVYISVDGVLTDELDGDADYVQSWSQKAAAAYEVSDTIEYLKNNMWIGEDYVAAVNSAKAAYEALSMEQQELVLNSTITINYTGYDIFDYLCNLHDSLKTSADNLLEGFGESGAFGTDFTEENWQTFNAYYAAIKDYDCVLAYLTEEKVAAYNAARYNSEKDTLSALKAGIAQTQADYAAGKISLQDALEAYYGEYKGLYETLGDYSLAEIDAEYSVFVLWVLGENYKGVTAAINSMLTEMNALVERGAENVTYSELVEVYKRYSDTIAWYTGSNYFVAYQNGLSTCQYSYVNWMNATCPSALTEEYNAATAAYSAIYSFTTGSTGAFIKGFATEIVTKEYTEKNYPTSAADASAADLSALTLEQAKQLYADVSAMYYITYRGGASVIGQYIVPGTTTIMYQVLDKYRTAIANYIASLESAAE